MFCKPGVQLILESLWAEMESGRAGIRLMREVSLVHL